MSDAMLADWKGPLGGLPPLDAIAPEQFVQAFQTAIDDCEREIDGIADNPEPPDHANTLAALGQCGRPLRRLRALFNVAADTMADPQVSAAAPTILAMLAAHDDRIGQHASLHARLAALAGRDAHPANDIVQARRRARLLERTLQDFHMSGASLGTVEKARLIAIGEEMAACHAGFRRILIEDEADLLPLTPAEHAGLPLGLADRPVPCTRATIEPILTQHADRGVRERAWRLFAARGDRAPDRCTLPLATTLLRLRAERARLLGFASHAELVTSNRMAAHPGAALALLDRLWPAARAKADRELETLAAMARDDRIDRLEPWDVAFYRERDRQHRLGAGESALSQYLTLDGLRDGLFWLAERLFGLRFAALPEAPVHHPDVRAYRVERAGEAVGALYLDPFARTGKTGGAWVQPLRQPERGHDLPIAMIVHNIARPQDGAPAHLRLWDAVTLFHEFGHALHLLLGDVEDHRQSAFHVPWDFVELPSTMFENWLTQPDMLAAFARDPATGLAIPADLAGTLRHAVAKSGIETAEYLAAAIIDLRLHMQADPPADLRAFEDDARTALGMPDALRPLHPLAAFRHLFAGGEPTYSAGYYVYIWAELMSADIVEAFADAPGGLLDRPTAQRLEHSLLSVGDADPPDTAFRAFRGRDPSPDALLRSRGLVA